MLIAILFWTMTFTCCSYSAYFGRSDAKIYALFILLASFLTSISQYVLGLTDHNWVVISIDFTLLIIFYVLALRSAHYWPVWITGLHLLTCLSHIVSLLMDNYLFSVYFGLQAIWAVLGQFFMAFGIYLDNAGATDGPTNRGAKAPIQTFE
jgi:hypothetical protein